MKATAASPKGMKDERYNDHDLVNLKCDPRLAEAFREQYPEILPGFYCGPACGYRPLKYFPVGHRPLPPVMLGAEGPAAVVDIRPPGLDVLEPAGDLVELPILDEPCPGLLEQEDRRPAGRRPARPCAARAVRHVL